MEALHEVVRAGPGWIYRCLRPFRLDAESPEPHLPRRGESAGPLNAVDL
jgi:hypothetical protein